MLNSVQTAAYELIQSDARFLYTLTAVQQGSPRVKSNYIMMSQPYIGIFADGAEQWCRKLGLNAPKFNDSEKAYYAVLRQAHKLYELPYADFKALLLNKLQESDEYFYGIRSFREKLLGYYNVGTDVYEDEFCGNTILCALYTPVKILGNPEIGPWMRNISVVVGRLANFFKCRQYPSFRYSDRICVKTEDYHFYDNCPLKVNTDLSFVLLSLLCSINFVTVFIDSFFVDEIPQKFKFAYLQYYYLCDFIKELNATEGTSFIINDSMKNRSFRNCLAHYGLGQYISEEELIPNDLLKGLTNKAFDTEYIAAKERLYFYLNELVQQIKRAIFSISQ